MSNKPNHRRDHDRIQDHGPGYESHTPAAGCNSTHVAQSRAKWKRRNNRQERRTGEVRGQVTQTTRTRPPIEIEEDGMPDWTDDLFEDEAALLGYSELTDRLIFRVAYNRKMASRCAARLKEAGLWLQPGTLTPEEMVKVREHFDALQAAPKHVEDERLAAECRERGGHVFGPVQIEGSRPPFVRCGHCRSSMTEYQLPLVRPGTP